MINAFFVPDLEDVDVKDLWFQKYSAKCHTANERNNYLRKFLASALSRFWAWPSVSRLITQLYTLHYKQTFNLTVSLLI